MVEMFSKYNIKNVRISGYDGKIIGSYKDIEYVTERTVYEIGCTFSHLKAIKCAYENDEDIAIIMEDDVLMNYYDKWKYKINEIVNMAPKNWEIIKLHCAHSKHIKKLLKRSNKSLFSPWEQRSTSTGCYIINKIGMKNIIDKFWKEYKWIVIHPLPIADNLIYSSIKTYDYVFPTFTHQITHSLIHSEFLDEHEEALDIIKNFFGE
jgi:GR25 family glycosyltransferase involved in LPS biosynthesis